MVRDTRLGVSRNVSDTLVALLNLLTVAHRVGVHAVLVARVRVLVLAGRREVPHALHTLEASLVHIADKVVHVDEDVRERRVGAHVQRAVQNRAEITTGAALCLKACYGRLDRGGVDAVEAVIVAECGDEVPRQLLGRRPVLPVGAVGITQVHVLVARVILRRDIRSRLAKLVDRHGDKHRAQVGLDVEGTGDVAAEVASLLHGCAVRAVKRVPVGQDARRVLAPR
mmetsp:Transcript_38288/g.113485  ORF Transcript_38288/g.113485 Transcript_38288/m.113485 type:complete len:226 (+) Transcript_38288:2077-2754(+)